MRTGERYLFQGRFAERTGWRVVHASIETGAAKGMAARRRHRLPHETTAQSAFEIGHVHLARCRRAVHNSWLDDRRRFCNVKWNVSIHLVKKRNMKGIFTFEPFQVGHDPVHHLVQFRVNLVVVDGQGHHPLGRVAHHFIFIFRFGCRSNDGGCGP